MATLPPLPSTPPVVCVPVEPPLENVSTSNSTPPFSPPGLIFSFTSLPFLPSPVPSMTKFCALLNCLKDSTT